MRHLLTVCIILFCGIRVFSQQQPAIGIERTFAATDSIQIDTLSIAPGSVYIYSGTRALKENKDYRVNYVKGYVTFFQIPDSVIRIRYHRLAINLNRIYRHKDTILIANDVMMSRNPFSYSPDSRESLFAGTDGLNLSGSLARGISFGNNQDLTVNSYLNLQVSGKLNNEIDVLAAVSDDNNPIQPEGNTQQLQDFDKVYIQFSKDKHKLIIGDFPMNKPERSYFMHYNKKSRGAQVSSQFNLSPKTTFSVVADAAVSRGRFARNIINGIEGNSGPYRLTGSNGEQYIIIISGTEVVYLDGQKLTRGEQHDYIIDYNSGEIVFMPRILITAYSRIVVEFQYSDRNYARSVFHTGAEAENKKYRLRFNYFSEQDNRNQPFQQDLTDEDKRTLQQAGDNLTGAFTTGAVPVSVFSPSLILYRKIDTLTFNGVYVYAPTSGIDTLFYQVTFSFVGNNRGNYIQAATAANGRVFQWIAPVNGVPQGSFEPVIPLVSPKQQQMLTLGADFMPAENTLISVELAHSRYDKNTFSDLNKSNDDGYGLQLLIQHTLPLDKSTDGWRLQSKAQAEVVTANFRYIERYRPVEFARTWNRELQNQTEADTSFEEQIITFSTGLIKTGLLSSGYQLSFYNRAVSFNGIQHKAFANLTHKRNTLTAEAEWLNTLSRINAPENGYKRYKAGYARQLPWFTSGLNFDREESAFRDSTKFLQANSYAFNQYNAFISNKDTSRFRFKVDLTQRLDYLSSFNEFKNATDARTGNLATSWNGNKGNRLLLNVTYREFRISDSTLVKTAPENSLLARAEYDYTFVKKVFAASTYYQVGSGRELVRDFQYVEVRPGQGLYAWYDFNENGIQENNEFVPAPFANQANYIKVFLPTNTFISVRSNQFNQTLNINPADVWGTKTGWRKWLARFSNITGIRIDRKVKNNNTLDYLNPFELNVNDTELVSTSSDLRNTFFFQRNNPVFGADYTWQQTRSKTQLTNGFDSRMKLEQGINVRYSPAASWTININSVSGRKSYASQFFSTNNFNFTYYETRPKLTYQVSNNLRLSALFTYYSAGNAQELGNEQATNREAGAELRYNILEKGVLTAKVSQFKVNFDGNVNSQVGFDMLQGLQKGNNLLWNLTFQQRLSNSIQINIVYDGRKSEGFDTVHTARFEARYIF
jgi:hypothetical protein